MILEQYHLISSINSFTRLDLELKNYGLNTKLKKSLNCKGNAELLQFRLCRNFYNLLYPISKKFFVRNYLIMINGIRIGVINQRIIIRRFTLRPEALRLVDYILYHGSFPRIYQMMNDDVSLIRELLLSYYDSIILKDCIANKSKVIRNITLFRDLALYLINNNACNYSYNKLAKLFGGSDITYKEFIGVMQDAYLFKEITNFNYSLKKQIRTNKKIYTIDNGFVWSMSMKLSKDQGRLFENLVYTELMKSPIDSIYYAQETGECDFITRLNNKLTAYQVCYQLTAENKQRELQGLTKTMEKWGIDKGYLLTFQQEENCDNKNITILPFWKWASGFYGK